MGAQLRSDSGQVLQTRFASTGATTAKEIHVFGARAWFPLNTKLATESNEFVFQSEISGAAKVNTEAWTPGQLLYWDNTAKKVTTTAGANTKCGYALQAALAADTESPIFLFNSFAT